MIKYLYVLASNDSDYYLEQSLMSITSLKMHMPSAFVSFLIDDVTEKTLVGKRKNILEFINEVKVVKIDSQFNKKARSRWLKTSMRQHIEGDFLYIDCDTIICEDLKEVENFDIDLGAVLDGHILLHDHSRRKYIQDGEKLLSLNFSSKTDKYFNSGVLFCRDIPICHSFFKEWHLLWLKGYLKSDIDQPSLNQVNIDFNDMIKEINGIWNCQILVGGMAFFVNAKIIHYFTTNGLENNPYTLTKLPIFQKIKEFCIIDDKIKEKLFHPKSEFSLQTTPIASKKILEIFDSYSFRVLKFIYGKKCFRLIERLLKILFDIRESRRKQ
jgi:lipopolysaccharide biosynthesis glycosyltransferase